MYINKMESSAEGRLGLQQSFPSHFRWKGKTFSEITSVLKNNNNIDHQQYRVSVFLKPQPLKGYRRESSTANVASTSRVSQSVRNFEIPGGASLVDTDICKGIVNTTDFQYNDDLKTFNPCSACDVPLQGATDSTFVRSLSAQDNARRRVRSSGMNKIKFIANKNNTSNYYTSSSQYLYGRNKTFKQNQFNNLRIEGEHAENNEYASNTIQSCNATNGDTKYVPVYYKPNNSKFAQQGGVTASTRLLRLKYDTITDAGASLSKAYGMHTANALAYGVPQNGYTIKDKIGYPNTCTPVFSKAHPNGIKQTC
jgi:hypothetical protein